MTPDTIDTPDESLCLLLGTDANGSEVQAPRCNEWPACVCGGPEGERQ